jgi:heme-degrading monooxygenase HmoA
MQGADGDDAMTSTAKDVRPTIARVWRGRTTAAKADEYAGYLYDHGIKPLVEKALGVQMLREDRAGESEFVTISYWESVAAMSRFAGDDPRRIHHLERDAEFLIELPSEVQILDIVASHGTTGDPSVVPPLALQVAWQQA